MAATAGETWNHWTSFDRTRTRDRRAVHPDLRVRGRGRRSVRRVGARTTSSRTASTRPASRKLPPTRQGGNAEPANSATTSLPSAASNRARAASTSSRPTLSFAATSRTSDVMLGQKREPGEEHQLSGGAACGEDADDEAAARDEPAVDDGGHERERHRPGAQPDEPTPQQHQLPGGRHEDGQFAAGGHQDQRCRDHPPHAEALHQRRRERRRQPVQQVDRHGRRDARLQPAEVLVQGVDQDRGCRPEAGDPHEGEGRDEPGVVQA